MNFIKYTFLCCTLLFATISVNAQCTTNSEVALPYCYDNNENIVIGSYTPPAGEAVTITFTAGTTESSDDILIYAGANGDDSDPLVATYSSKINGESYTGFNDEKVSIYTDSDGSFSCETWTYTPLNWTSSCAVGLPAPLPPLTTGNDCDLSEAICAEAGSAFIAAPGLGVGGADAGTDFGCLLSGEQNPSWWWFQIETGGDVDIAITPLVPTDYDYAVWGPFTSSQGDCGNGDAPVDCSYDGGTDPEEMNLTGTIAGEYYILLVNDHSESGVNYTLELLGTSSGTTNCSVVSCAADAGTITQTSTGMGSGAVGDGYVLCIGESVTLASNDDYVLPDPEAGEVSELMYAMYDAIPPTDPSPTDTEFTGVFWTGEDITGGVDGCATNDFGIASCLGGLSSANNTVWFVPVTVDDSDNGTNPNGVFSIDANADDCYDYGTPVQVTVLDEIAIANTSTGCTWAAALSGGAVDHATFLGTATEYTYNITPDATALGNGAAAAATGLMTTGGGTIAAPAVLADGTYTITVTEDGNGCTSADFDVVLSSCVIPVCPTVGEPCDDGDTCTEGSVQVDNAGACDCAAGTPIDFSAIDFMPVEGDCDVAPQITLPPGYTCAYAYAVASGLTSGTGPVANYSTPLVSGDNGNVTFTITRTGCGTVLDPVVVPYNCYECTPDNGSWD